MKQWMAISLALTLILSLVPLAAAGDNARDGDTVIVKASDHGKAKAHLLSKKCDVKHESDSGFIVARCPGGKKDASGEGVGAVFEDEVLHGALNTAKAQIKADLAYNTYGADGNGIKIGLVDTGVDSSHPGLSGKVVAEQDFTTEGTPNDLNGHGTATGSVIVSQDTSYNGVAPAAQLINAKAGDSTATFLTSDVIEATDWAVSQGAKVISMSVGGATSNCAASAIANYVNSKVASSNVQIIVPSGNGGPGASTIWTPGCAENAVTVGAVDKLNALASFSSRGPTDDGRIKPDLMAPGVQIYTANLGSGFSARDGTSFSVPFVSSVVAMMHQKRAGLYADEVKAILRQNAMNLGYSENEQGKGLVDALNSVAGAINWPTYANATQTLSAPASVARNVVFNLNDSIYNNGNTAGTSISADLLALPSNVVLVSGADPQSVGTIDARSNGYAGWQLKGKKAGTYTVSVMVSGANVPTTTKTVQIVVT